MSSVKQEFSLTGKSGNVLQLVFESYESADEYRTTKGKSSEWGIVSREVIIGDWKPIKKRGKKGKYYIDENLVSSVPNKYNLTVSKIKKLIIKDWDALKTCTWLNNAKTDGTWWCHLEGCNLRGRYNSSSEFWIGFNEDNNKIDCTFSCYDGMCHYIFEEFYKDVENKYDFIMQVNTLRYLNSLIDRGILVIEGD